MKNLVLVVDDEANNQELLSACLSKQGFSPLIAHNGTAGLELARQQHPALILLDTLMPGIDGFETCRQLKADPVTRNIPVILMADAGEDDQAGFDAGADDYFIRPIRPRQLATRLVKYLLMYDLSVQLEATDQLLAQHSALFAVTSEVGKQITSILDPAQLTKAVVDLLQKRFNYYYVSIWQLNDRQDVLMLRAGIGRHGYQPFSPDFTLHKDSQHSIVATVARLGQAYNANDVLQDPAFMARFELPDADIVIIKSFLQQINNSFG